MLKSQRLLGTLAPKTLAHFWQPYLIEVLFQKPWPNTLKPKVRQEWIWLCAAGSHSLVSGQMATGVLWSFTQMLLVFQNAIGFSIFFRCDVQLCLARIRTRTILWLGVKIPPTYTQKKDLGILLLLCFFIMFPQSPALKDPWLLLTPASHLPLFSLFLLLCSLIFLSWLRDLLSYVVAENTIASFYFLPFTISCFEKLNKRKWKSLIL